MPEAIISSISIIALEPQRLCFRDGSEMRSASSIAEGMRCCFTIENDGYRWQPFFLQRADRSPNASPSLTSSPAGDRQTADRGLCRNVVECHVTVSYLRLSPRFSPLRHALAMSTGVSHPPKAAAKRDQLSPSDRLKCRRANKAKVVQSTIINQRSAMRPLPVRPGRRACARTGERAIDAQTGRLVR